MSPEGSPAMRPVSTNSHGQGSDRQQNSEAEPGDTAVPDPTTAREPSSVLTVTDSTQRVCSQSRSKDRAHTSCGELGHCRSIPTCQVM